MLLDYIDRSHEAQSASYANNFTLSQTMEGQETLLKQYKIIFGNFIVCIANGFSAVFAYTKYAKRH